MTDPTNLIDPARPLHRLDADAMPNATADATAAVEERRASEFATHGDPTLSRHDVDPVSKRPGVQWVRPTDLAARAAGTVVDRGADLNSRLHAAVLEGVRDGRAQLQERLARRQTQLEPDTSQTATLQRPLGRTGVSR